MLQEVMTAPGVIEFREIPVPEMGEGQILLMVMKIGVCGSDIHVYQRDASVYRISGHAGTRGFL